MRSFVDIKNKNYSFSSCVECESRCCDGLKRFILSQVSLDEFQSVSKDFPILFILEEDFLFPVILLSNGKGFCKYLKDFECTIYDNRPNVCRVYPLSPNLENDILIDEQCPAVKLEDKALEELSLIVKEGIVQEQYQNDIFNGYQKSFLRTYLYFKEFNKKANLEFQIEINGKKFYRFKNSFDDPYIQIHKESLKNFDSYFRN